VGILSRNEPDLLMKLQSLIKNMFDSSFSAG